MGRSYTREETQYLIPGVVAAAVATVAKDATHSRAAAVVVADASAHTVGDVAVTLALLQLVAAVVCVVAFVNEKICAPCLPGRADMFSDKRRHEADFRKFQLMKNHHVQIDLALTLGKLQVKVIF